LFELFITKNVGIIVIESSTLMISFVISKLFFFSITRSKEMGVVKS